MKISVEDLFDLSQFSFSAIFDGIGYPWEVLVRIKTFIADCSKQLPADYEQFSDFVWVGKGTFIEKTAVLKGPAIIGRDVEIRHAAFIRENVLIGDRTVVGNSTEIKNSILFNNVQAPHFNYVGDSILGYKSHIGAGVICSNLKSVGGQVRVRTDGGVLETGLRKLGAILGDYAEVGCNSVLNPGTIVGRHSVVYPLSSVTGCVPEKSILKRNGKIVDKRED